jgi:hypothetical protein
MIRRWVADLLIGWVTMNATKWPSLHANQAVLLESKRDLFVALQEIATRIPPPESDELARRQWEIADRAIRNA